MKNKKSSNFSEWYTEAILSAELMEYSDVSGCMIFRAESIAMWEKIRDELDKRIRKLGVKNVYFPLLIPEKFLKKEAEFMEGFSPEVAWVTHAGNSRLSEKLAIRPTSEAIMYPYLAKWIRSWKDLPFKMNQWSNIVRWEFNNPVPFLRTREFLFNEGHTAFATKKEADEEVPKIMKIYNYILKDMMALPSYAGRKTDKEKFAGGLASFSFEHILPSKKAIQGPAVHQDGQNFSKAYNISFLDQNKKKQYVWQNTWAISTRNLGVMLAVHGDDRGLVIPPKMASKKAVIIPIYNKNTKKEVLKNANKIKKLIPDSFVDNRKDYSPGYKFHEWELKGIPLRIEIGPRDIKNNQVVLVRRDTLKKTQVKIPALKKTCKQELENMHKNLYTNALKFMKENTREAKTYSELKQILKKHGGFVKASWCGSQKCEEKIKDETGAKITNLPFEFQKNIKGNCIFCNEKAKHIANFAKSY